MSDIWKKYLSVESLKAMSLNEEIGPDTILPLAEAYEGCQENLASTLESEERNIARALKAEADNERLRALIKAAEFEGGSRVPGSCPWCGQWKVHSDCPAFAPTGEVK